MSDKWALRLLAIWLAAVVLSLMIGLTASMTGHNHLGAIMGVTFISLFGGALLAAIFAIVIVLWLVSNEIK